MRTLRAAASLADARHAVLWWLAWSGAAVGAALILIRYLLEAGTTGDPLSGVAGVVLPLAFPGVGVLLATRRPRHPIGWLFLAAGLGWGVADAAGAYSLAAPPGSAAAGVARWLHGWPSYLGVGALLLVVALFPDGRSASRSWRPLVPFIAGYTAVGMMLVGRDPAADPALRPLALPLLAAAAVSLVLRWVRAAGHDRQQMKWLVAASSVVLVVLAAAAAVEALAPRSGLVALARVALYASVCLIPLSVAVAILRHRLYDIDLLINRALVYGTLTLTVIAFYVAVVGYVGSLLSRGDEMGLSLVVTGITALLFQPLRERIQLAVDRLLYGHRREPYTVLSDLGRRLEQTVATDALIGTLVASVRGSLKLSYAAIAVGVGDEPVVAAASGVPGPEPLRIPLTYQGDVVGALLLSPRKGEQLSAADRRLLDDLGRQAGVVVHAVRLTTELREANARLLMARERLVSAREEERRRVRRDLHDGLGPRLASLTLRLEAARDELAHEPETAALLGDLAERTREGIMEIRRLVSGLRPAALDDLGLGPALSEVATEYEQPGRLRITVEASELPALPAAVEVAAYRIALEAMTNAARHAAARRCAVRVAVEAANELIVEVRDDGRGLPSDARAGVGLASMRERAAELGGKCDIGRAPAGGTHVRAVIPLRGAGSGDPPTTPTSWHLPAR